MSLTFCWFTVQAPTMREKIVIAIWVVAIPSLISAYNAQEAGEVWAAVRGSLGPWIGVTFWQLYQRRGANKNYDEILNSGDVTEEDCSGQTSTTERGFNAPISGRD
jgi:hypothetical protein